MSDMSQGKATNKKNTNQMFIIIWFQNTQFILGVKANKIVNSGQKLLRQPY